MCFTNCNNVIVKENQFNFEECLGCTYINNIKLINSNEAKEIIEKREPLGLFFTIEDGLYVGIDNTTGDAWAEEFLYKDACFYWLEGRD